jgi:anti-sigma regulatory factor (Ser/Thr protein kinase)
MSSFETIAEQAQLAAVTEFVRKAARSASFSESDLLAVDLIVEEVFLNIAMHGYQDEPGPVAIHCTSPEAGVLTIQFHDWAKEFNPLAAHNNPSPQTVGGQGLVVVKSLANSITYRRIANTNDLQVRMLKQP